MNYLDKLPEFNQQGTPIDRSNAINFRSQCRSGSFQSQTSGHCMEFIQTNVTFIPKAYAFDFLLFCQKNPKPCPLLEVTEEGNWEPEILAPNSDLRTDLPKYNILQEGEITDSVTDITEHWSSDLYAFLIGCSFSFEERLIKSGIPMRHMELNEVVSAFDTNISTRQVGPFKGPVVVSMRPIREELVETAVEVTKSLPEVHGAPLAVGHPERIGIQNIRQPDYGEPVEIKEGEIPLFWGCGITAMRVLKDAKIPFAITHSPGHMFITSKLNDELNEEDFKKYIFNKMAYTRGTMAPGADSTPFLRNGRVNFTIEQFNLFWNVKLTYGTYIYELVKYIAETEKSKKVQGLSIEQALATLYMITFSMPKDEFPEEGIKQAKRKWRNHRASHPALNNTLDEIILCSISVHKNKDELIEILISHCLNFPSPIRSIDSLIYQSYFGEELKVIAPGDLTANLGVGGPYFSANPKFSILDCGEFSLVYYYLKEYLKDESTLPVAVLDMIHRKNEEMLISVSSGSVSQAEKSLLPLLHIFENLFTRIPIFESEKVESYLLEIDIFRRWPMPYGSSANRVLEKLLLELKSPGSSLIRKFREELPVIDNIFPLFEENPYKYEYPAQGYMIIDEEDPEIGYFSKIIQLNESTISSYFHQIKSNFPERLNDTALFAHILRIKVMLFILASYSELEPHDVSFMAGLTVQDAFTLYKRILDIISTSCEADAERSRQLQKKYFFEFLVELPHVAEDENSELKQVLFEYLSSSKTYLPSFPPHKLTKLNLSQEDFETEFELTHRSEDSFILGKSQEALSEVFQKRFEPESSLFEAPAKFVVVGGDQIFHEFLNSYVEALVQNPDFFECDIRVYVVPCYGIKNSVADYLYSIDPWYLRHVYVPFALRPWVPRLDSSAQLKLIKKDPLAREIVRKSIGMSKSDGGLYEDSLPLKISASLLDDYLLEADQVVPFTIYKVQCWYTRPDGTPPNLEIPFCLYFEIGINPSIKDFQENNPEFGNKSAAEVLDSKLFRYQNIECILRIPQMDLFGLEYVGCETITKRIHHFVASNVPRENDRGTNPIPSAEWLEIWYNDPESALEEANFEKKMRNRKGKETLANVNVALSTLYASLHSANIEIFVSDPSRKIPIIVDGKIYKEFNSFIIEPVMLDDGSLASIPVMGFLEPDI